DVEASPSDPFVTQRVNECCLVDDWTARRVHQVGRWLHQGELPSPDQGTAARAEHDVNAYDVGWSQQVILRAGQFDARFLAIFGCEVLTPCDHSHVHRLRDLGDAGAKLAEPDDAKSLAFGIRTNRGLPETARFEPRVLGADVAQELQHEPDRDGS